MRGPVSIGRTGWRSRIGRPILGLVALLGLTIGAPAAATVDPCGDGTATLAEDERSATISALASELMAEQGLSALLLRVTVDGRPIVTEALGESPPGVPVTTDMHFPNGMVVIGYLPTILLQEVERGSVRLDDPIARWLPDLPASDRVTLRMLAASTSGYPDYVADEAFVDRLYADPFQHRTAEELIEIAMSRPLWFEPGATFRYSHTNFVLLGQALQEITGRPLPELLWERIVEPLGLAATQVGPITSVEGPVLHTFTGERGVFEESTHWSTAWHIGPAARMATTICDLARSAKGIGSGELLSEDSHRLQVERGPMGPAPGCPPEICAEPPPGAHFGLGLAVTDAWITATPSFGGFGAVQAYLPERAIGIAIATTSGPTTGEGNHARELFRRIAAALVGDEAGAPAGRERLRSAPAGG